MYELLRTRIKMVIIRQALSMCEVTAYREHQVTMNSKFVYNKFQATCYSGFFFLFFFVVNVYICVIGLYLPDIHSFRVSSANQVNQMIIALWGITLNKSTKGLRPWNPAVKWKTATSKLNTKQKKLMLMSTSSREPSPMMRRHMVYTNCS